jgi:hypothetical protein
MAPIEIVRRVNEILFLIKCILFYMFTVCAETVDDVLSIHIHPYPSAYVRSLIQT